MNSGRRTFLIAVGLGIVAYLTLGTGAVVGSVGGVVGRSRALAKQ